MEIWKMMLCKGFHVRQKNTGLRGVVVDDPSESGGPFPGETCYTVVFAVGNIPSQRVCLLETLEDDTLTISELQKNG
jgi:hypothetical protein